MSAVLVLSYTVLRAVPMPPVLPESAPFVLSVVLTLGVNALSNIRQQSQRPDMQRDVLIATGVVYGLILLVLLIRQDPLWCQRVFTLLPALKALWIGYALWRAPEDLRKLSGLDDSPAGYMMLWGRWKLVSLLFLVLLNEAAIRYGTLEEWIILWAVAPAAVFCLSLWILMVLWVPDEDEG